MIDLNLVRAKEVTSGRKVSHFTAVSVRGVFFIQPDSSIVDVRHGSNRETLSLSRCLPLLLQERTLAWRAPQSERIERFGISSSLRSRFADPLLWNIPSVAEWKGSNPTLSAN